MQVTGSLNNKSYFEKGKRRQENLLSFPLDQLTRSLPSSDLTDIEDFIIWELRRLRPNVEVEPERKNREYFTIYKNAFDQIIEQKVTVSKNMLTAVKSEYEKCITALETGQRQAVYLQGMLESMMVEKPTLRHFINRGDELEDKLNKLHAYNTKLRNEILSSREARALRRASTESNTWQVPVKENRMLIPGLGLEELTDVGTLCRTLSRVEAQVKELNRATDTNFVEKKQKGLFQKQLSDKENTKSYLVECNEKLKKRCETLKVAVEATKSAIDDPEKVTNTYDIVIKALVEYGKSKYGKKSDKWKHFLGFDEDDPLKKKEAEYLIEYVDHFNDLMDFECFEAAAIHAANSPLCVLRTYDIMIRFKHAGFTKGKGTKSPLLIFCEALMATASVSQKISAAMSTECIRCALNENHIDLATHWIAKGWLNYSIPMGDILYNYCNCDGVCKCTAVQLAQTVYTEIGAYHKVANCLCKQEKFVTMLQILTEHSRFETDDYRNILLRNPSFKLAEHMLTTKRKDKKTAVLSFASMVGTLIKGGHEAVVLQILQDISNRLLQDSLSMKTISMEKLLSSETIGDEMSTEKWLHIVKLCQKENMVEIGLELLAALTVREAINNASIAYIVDYIS